LNNGGWVRPEESQMTQQPQSEHVVSIAPDTVLGTVALTVSDLSRSREFYERALGLQAADAAGGTIVLSAGGGHPLVELHGDSSAPRLDRRATGLYHLAILLPTRLDLALALARLAETRSPLDGASDHFVSEALYLSDPDGNGIEIYRDRPREEWRPSGGRLEMATLPLDLEGVLSERAGATEPQAKAPAGTTIGHVHLQVADIPEAEAFYHGILGFDVTVRGYPGALFVSAGGYHHHVGLNTWHSIHSPPPAPGSIGLRSFEVQLPDRNQLDAVLARLRAAGVSTAELHGAARVRDPSGNAVLLTTR
jgi:catechol 2,3-dioxygenase